MNLINILSISTALSMDAFAVAVATGIILKQVSLRQTFRLSWHFGLFQAMMPLIGWLAGQSVPESFKRYDHWIAFGLLFLIGANMIRESFEMDETKSEKDPTRGMSLIILSVATSIDALAVGFTFSMLNVSVWFPALIIGVVAASFTATGLHLGKKAAKYCRVGQYAERAGGAIMFIIGLKILYESGVF